MINVRPRPIGPARFGLETRRAILPALLLSAVFLYTSASARAQTTDNWLGATSNQWNDLTNWDGGIPNSSTVTVVITNTTNNPVVINDINPTIGNLTLSSSSTGLTLANGYSLTVDGGPSYGVISNAGTITIGGSGYNTDLIINSTVSLSGGGFLDLSNSGTNRIYAGSAGSVLTMWTIRFRAQGSLALAAA